MNEPKRSFWLTPNGLAALGLIGGVLYFLLSEHRAHFIYGLPYLILLLCPVMHFFMHGGHGRHDGYGKDSKQYDDAPNQLQPREQPDTDAQRNKEPE
ncbi:MAG: DUF2933 domain-containing protein [Burkholderiaceae bacterium]